jgi:hypothetical protein
MRFLGTRYRDQHHKGEKGMSEALTFHFEGALADSHRMNFYECARFQYAAARLMVKLAQFRKQGSFKKKITNSSNFNIELVSQSNGSFNINIEDHEQLATEDSFIEISLPDLDRAPRRGVTGAWPSGSPAGLAVRIMQRQLAA